MAIKVFLFALCSISTAIAGEYGLHEVPLISLQHFHEDYNGGHDPGGEHIEEGSSLAQEYIGDGHSGNHDVHGDVIEHGSPILLHVSEQSYPNHEINSEFLHSSHVSNGGGSYDLDGHLEVHRGTSYVNIKGHDGKKQEYIVDHSSHGGDHTGTGIGHESYGLNTYAAGHGTDYVSVKQHPLKSESFIILHHGGGEGGGQAESQHNIYDDSSSSPHTYTHDIGGHEAVSTSSFKDYNKGTSYSVKQTHGHKGVASVTSKLHEQSHETEQIHGDYSGGGDDIQSTQHDENLIQHSAEFDPHSHEFSQHSLHKRQSA